MKKLLFFLLLLPLGVAAQQQKPLYSSQRLTDIQSLHREFDKKYTDNYEKTLKLAKQNGWQIFRRLSNGRVLMLAGVNENNHPIYVGSDNNADAAATTHTDALYAGGSLGLNLNGGSDKMKNRLGIWEAAGIPLASHQELKGRIIQKDNATSSDQHATHVAGTLIASGVVPKARGMAWGMQGLQSYDATSDISEITLASANILLSNHSYGELAGWEYNPDRPVNKWEWYGDDAVSQSEDYKFGFYGSKTSDLDRVCYAAPSYLHVKSAGNASNSSGPGSGGTYYLGSGNTTSTITRSPNGIYGNLPLSGNAKNILSVAAVYAIPGGNYQGAANVRLADFSSSGPTDDGRIKPDISGVGLNVYSSSNESNTAYATLSGTSMSSPNVAGSLFLLQEHYANLHSGTFMLAATLKGLAIHTADEAGAATGPDYQFGWGLLNTARAAQVITNTGNQHLLEEHSLAQGGTYTFQVTASGSGPLKATICWTDPEATATAATAANLNNRTPKLVNDLDLRISDGTTETLPWVLDFNNPAKAATQGDNIRDNVEQVLLANPIPGKTYTVTVKHKGTLQRGPQAYSVLVSGIGGKAYCSSAPSATGTVQISGITFGTLSNASAACTTYSDFTNVAGNVYYVKQSQLLSVKVANCTGNQDKVLKAFIDYNSDGDFADDGELIATSGVINGESTFTAQVLIPATVAVGNTLRLRLVLIATNDPNAVTACGNYGNGETEDYKITLIRPTTELALTDITTPANGDCASPTQNIVVRVQNNGTDTLSNFVLNLTVKDGSGNVVKTIQTTYKYKLAPLAADDFDFSTYFASQAGQTYTFTITSNLTGDQDNTNNSLIVSRTIANPATTPPGATAYVCGNDAFLSSTAAASDGVVYWYDAPSGGNLLGAGNKVTTAIKPAGNTYYAGLNDLRVSFGASDKYVFTGGTYSGNFGPQPLITTQVPLVIESARLYIGTSGIIYFLVVPLDESAIISSVYLNVTATRDPNTQQSSSTPSGQQTDDPNDPGAVYALNLKIPTPGQYKIIIGYGNGATIYRSNVGIGASGKPGFPFSVPGIISMKGSLYQSSATQYDTLKTAYYYLYNMQVRALNCAGPRIAVAATVNADAAPGAIVSGGGTFCSSENYAVSIALTGTPPWNLTYSDGTTTTTINNILTSPYTFKPLKSGTYQVTALSDAKSCKTFKTSGTATFTITNSQKPVITVTNGYVLTAPAGVAYTWYLNGVVLSYITQSINATSVGKYAVEVTSSNTNCPVLRSDEVTVTVAADEPVLANGLTVSPNPSSGQFVLQVSPAFPIIKRIAVKNILGQTLHTIIPAKGSNAIPIDLSERAGGVYFFSVETEQTTITKRVVKQ